MVRVVSWVVGAVDGCGGEARELKFVMEKRVMSSALADLQRMRSP